MDEQSQFIQLLSQSLPKKADAIALLAGDRFYRVPKVAELYHAGFAREVVVTSSAYDFVYGSFPSRMLVRALRSYDVKDEHIIAIEKAPHTRAEADETLRIAKERGWKKLILVTTEHHQYRAFLTWIKAARDLNVDIELIMVPVQAFPKFRYDTRNEALQQEFERIERYRDMGHVASYKDGIDYLS